MPDLAFLGCFLLPVLKDPEAAEAGPRLLPGISGKQREAGKQGDPRGRGPSLREVVSLTSSPHPTSSDEVMTYLIQPSRERRSSNWEQLAATRATSPAPARRPRIPPGGPDPRKAAPGHSAPARPVRTPSESYVYSYAKPATCANVPRSGRESAPGPQSRERMTHE